MNTLVNLYINSNLIYFEDLISMLIDLIYSFPESEIAAENKKLKELIKGLEVLSTILGHPDLKIPIIEDRRLLEDKVCDLIEMLPEENISDTNYRNFTKELKLIENGTKLIRTFFCWRFSQLTHPLEETALNYCNQLIEDGIDKMLERFVEEYDENSFIATKSKVVLERLECCLTAKKG